jgi:hypothetical protein
MRLDVGGNVRFRHESQGNFNAQRQVTGLATAETEPGRH